MTEEYLHFYRFHFDLCTTVICIQWLLNPPSSWQYRILVRCLAILYTAWQYLILPWIWVGLSSRFG